MVAVTLKVTPAEGRRDECLNIAGTLRPLLEQIDGFIAIERFESLTQSGKLLSLSFFRDEQGTKNLAYSRVAPQGASERPNRRV